MLGYVVFESLRDCDIVIVVMGSMRNVDWNAQISLGRTDCANSPHAIWHFHLPWTGGQVVLSFDNRETTEFHVPCKVLLSGTWKIDKAAMSGLVSWLARVEETVGAVQYVEVNGHVFRNRQTLWLDVLEVLHDEADSGLDRVAIANAVGLGPLE